MSAFGTYPLQNESVLTIYADRDRLQMAPDYQRQGEIWSLEKRQLLMDSLINKYDIPKLYFHKYSRETAAKTRKDFSVIDGRQRLEAIFQFIEGQFPLSGDFEYLDDATIKAGGLTYSQLAKQYPRLKQRFDAFSLPIVVVETDDVELIEDMFSRLNEAVPLNAAEKRNAIGGDMAAAFRQVASHKFFKQKVRFSPTRYRHREVAARLIFIEYSLRRNRLVDTKKPFLDQITRDYRNGKRLEVRGLTRAVEESLERLISLFGSKDMLLAAQAAVPIYFLLSRESPDAIDKGRVNRARLEEFNQARQANREVAAEDFAKARFDLLEYDRLSQQGTNDASSIRERLRIIRAHLRLPDKHLTTADITSR